MKVLSYNIHKGFGPGNRRFTLHGIRAKLIELQPDLVFLQEVVGENQRRRKRVRNYPEETHFEHLADSVWPYFSYGQNAAYDHGHHGNAFLSRWPISSTKNHDVSASRWESRGILHSALNCEGSTIHTFCIHFGLFLKYREEQVKQLCHFVQTVTSPSDPIIIAGDFNDWTQKVSPALRESLDAQEVFEVNCGAPRKTFPSLRPSLPLDRIYTRGFHVVSCETLRGGSWRRLSDHLPLLCELRLHRR